MRAIFAPNLCEDWDSLRRLFAHAARERIGLMITTRIAGHPLPQTLRSEMASCVQSLGTELDGGGTEEEGNIDEVAARLVTCTVHPTGRIARRYVELHRVAVEALRAKYASLLEVVADHPGIGFVAVAGGFDTQLPCDDSESSSRLRALLATLEPRLLANGSSRLPFAAIGGAVGSRRDAPPDLQCSTLDRCSDEWLDRLFEPAPPFVVLHELPPAARTTTEERLLTRLNGLGRDSLVALSSPLAKVAEASARLSGGALLLYGSFLATSCDDEETSFFPGTFWELTWQNGAIVEAALRQFPPADLHGYARQILRVVPCADGTIQQTQFEEPYARPLVGAQDLCPTPVEQAPLRPTDVSGPSRVGRSLQRTAIPESAAERVARTVVHAPRTRRQKRRLLNVVLVEESRPLAIVLRRLLERHGFTVREAQREDEALAVARSHRPDVVVLDTVGSDGNGSDFLRQLRREHGESVRVVALCSNEPGGRKTDLERSADVCVPRDFDVARLLSAVSGATSARSRRAVAERVLTPGKR